MRSVGRWCRGYHTQHGPAKVRWDNAPTAREALDVNVDHSTPDNDGNFSCLFRIYLGYVSIELTNFDLFQNVPDNAPGRGRFRLFYVSCHLQIIPKRQF